MLVVEGVLCLKQLEINVAIITSVTNIGLVVQRAQELQSEVPVSHMHRFSILIPLQLIAQIPDTRLNA